MAEKIYISDDDEEIIMFLNNRRRRPSVINERPDYFQILDDAEFYKRFRLSKPSVRKLHDEIHVQIESPTQRNNAIPAMVKILLTLRYYALGTILLDVGDFAGVSKTSAHKIVWETTRAIAQLRNEYITFPNTRETAEEAVLGIYNIARFPRVIGAIDCTHVKIQSPGGNDAEVYRNRKGTFSFNVQAVVGPKLKIYDIVARWPGSTHDQTIFNNSAVNYRFESGRMGDRLLLGDSGYAYRPYLITPLLQPQTPADNLFNESQIRTRNVVERCFGVWKRRFPLLRRGLCMKIEGVQAVVVATAVLQYLECDMNDDVPPEVADIPAIEELEDGEQMNMNDHGNDRVRQALINEYFSTLN